jgi:RNA polymerase sigma factor (sigma-70 family)
LSFETIQSLWAWVYKTALNRVRDFYDEQHVRRLKTSEIALDWFRDREDGPATGLEHATRQELATAVAKAMKALKLRHRSILTLRCFQQLSYAQITQVMGGSQLQAKLLFFRAKQSLRRQLVRDGFDRSALLPALGVFAAVTLPSGHTAAAALVSAHSVKVSTWTAVLAAATSKLAMLLLCAMGGLAAVATVASTNRLPQGLALFDPGAGTRTQGDAFTYPSRAWDAQDRDAGGFESASGDPPLVVRPVGSVEEILVGEPYSRRPCLILPTGRAVEMAFDRRIVDGPGPDILIAGWGCRHQVVTLTDGAQASLTLPVAPCEGNRGQLGVLAIDLAEFRIPFEVRTVRIEGSHWFTQDGFYRLSSVRARTVP